MDISFLTLNKIAHRGIHDKYIENTLKSFLECIKRGYLIELDIRLTKDNYLVVFHDISLKRLFNKNKNINDLTLNELREYKLIPTLEEVF